MLSRILNAMNYAPHRIGKDCVNGLTVSTVLTPDYGYETAIGDKHNWYPVERYPDMKTAKSGHVKWCARAKTIKRVLALGGLGGLVPDKVVTLVRYEPVKIA